MVNMNFNFWAEKSVLITGHTGFKGAWLALWLTRMGARVAGIALPPSTSPSLYSLAHMDKKIVEYTVDIRDSVAVAETIKLIQPEIVFHLAAQALVSKGYREPIETFSANVIGTVNVLDALRHDTKTRVVVAATTDKVYKNLEQAYPYRETDTLGGSDPYSASKAAAEFVISCYRDSYLKKHGIAVGVARAGNVIGGGDWSEDRLIPDAMRAWSANRTLYLRRPQSIRPWQHVLEPLAGYIKLAEMLWDRPELSDAYNFGPDSNEAASVGSVISLAREFYGKGDISVEDGQEAINETNLLTLEVAKARNLLGISARWHLNESISRTVSWYREFYEGRDVTDLCNNDFDLYETLH